MKVSANDNDKSVSRAAKEYNAVEEANEAIDTEKIFTKSGGRRN